MTVAQVERAFYVKVVVSPAPPLLRAEASAALGRRRARPAQRADAAASAA